MSASARKVLGIDLGTTNSVCALVTGGKAVVIRDGDERLVPSMVGIGEEGAICVGRNARSRRLERPDKVVYSAKRLLGRRFGSPEVRKIAELMPYRLVEGPNESVEIELGGRRLSVIAIQAEILRHLRHRAQEQLGERVVDAVIAVPANFSEAQRQATKQAAQQAGLNVVRMINEPTAAALSYGYSGNREGKIAVFDFGGGTFDITILDIQKQVYRVLSTAGDMFLGGDDIDQAVVEHIMQWLGQQHGLYVKTNPRALANLRELAETAKHALGEQSTIQLDLRAALPGRIAPLLYELTRTEFERIAQTRLTSLLPVCRDALTWAGVEVGALDDVVLIGGSTQIPLVRNLVRDFFGREPNCELNPSTAVAIGAAVQGASLVAAAEKTQDPWLQPLLMDVAPRSLGVRTLGGQVDILVERNSSIPLAKTRFFSTSHSRQSVARIEICEGEARRFEENLKLGELLLSDLPAIARDRTQIAVTFEIDANGLLSVRAQEEMSGKEARAEIRLSGVEAA